MSIAPSASPAAGAAGPRSDCVSEPESGILVNNTPSPAPSPEPTPAGYTPPQWESEWCKSYFLPVVWELDDPDDPKSKTDPESIYVDVRTSCWTW